MKVKLTKVVLWAKNPEFGPQIVESKPTGVSGESRR